jgi:hypothetical protein
MNIVTKMPASERVSQLCCVSCSLFLSEICRRLTWPAHTRIYVPHYFVSSLGRKTCFPTPPRKSCKRLQQCLQVRNIAHDSMPNKTVASNPDTSGTCMKDVSATETAFSVSLHVLSENECDDRTEDANENQNGVIASTNGFMNAETEVACNAIGCSLQEEGLPNHEKGSGSDAPISTINAVSNCVASSLACTTSTSSAVFSEIRKANEVSETSNYPGLLQPAGVGSGVGHSDHNDLRRQTHCRNILGHNSLQSVVAERPTAKPSDSSRTLVNSNQTRDLRTKTVACTGSSASSVNADGLHSKRSLNAGFDIDLPRKMIRRQSASQSLNKRVVRDTIGNNCYQDQTVSKEDNGSQRQPQSQFVPAASFRSSSKAKPSSVVEPAKSAFVHGAAGANREKQSMKQATVNCNQNRDHTRKGDVHSASPTQVSSMPSTSAASMNIRRLCERQCLDDGEGDYHRLTGVTPARVRKPACVTSNSTPRGTVASDRMPGLSSDRCIECGNETGKPSFKHFQNLMPNTFLICHKALS